MAVRSKTQLLALYGSLGTIFGDNTSREISESDIRSFGQDLVDSLGLSLTSLNVDTSPATFEFDFELYDERVFVCSPAFTGVKSINLSNFANAKHFKFVMEITGGAVINFTSVSAGFRMDDVRWNLGPDLFIEPGDGKFLGEATFDGTDWFVKISGGPYVKT